MSQLIHLAQRIKAVSTIKKITSAMRLISRSFHTRMHKEAQFVNDYTRTLHRTLDEIHSHLPEKEPVSDKTTPDGKKLIILIGSQKGLCGSYNSTITHWINRHLKELQSGTVTVFVLGKKIDDYLKGLHIVHHRVFPELKLSNINTVTKELLAEIKDKKHNYTHVISVSNWPKTFLSHEYRETQLVPFTYSRRKISTESFDYAWSHTPETVLDTVIKTELHVNLYSVLFFSLSGEQSSRFIAMDNATRNANKFLDTMKLQFNKMRQAKITKELSELAGAFETQSSI